ncbi:M28 family peptidase [Thiofilum flexile]|uniref:M28 family peptidase n=1 Tax=Thiofilum flexile TaxID=125627 RepID=UPI000374EF12|nr:M28 family peptidase [Thiofilum flexile]
MMKRLKILLDISLMLSPLLLWFVVTQPLFDFGGGAPKNTLAIDISPERLKAHVRKLAEELPPRTFPDYLDQSAAYIQEQWSAYGKVDVLPYQSDGETYRNLSITFGSTVGAAVGPSLIIGAHYDAHESQPGADDNASGVAGLLELARLLSHASLDRPVTLVAFTLEEPPFFRTPDMGSAVYAKALQEQGTAVELVMILEMIGYYSDEPDSQSYPLPLMSYLYSDRGDFIAVVGDLGSMGIVRQTKADMRQAMTLPVYSINAPRLLPGIDFSDHRSFWARGFPALMITDTAFYRNLNYHSKADTWDKLDYVRMADVLRGVMAVIVERAGQNDKSNI